MSQNKQIDFEKDAEQLDDLLECDGDPDSRIELIEIYLKANAAKVEEQTIQRCYDSGMCQRLVKSMSRLYKGEK